MTDYPRVRAQCRCALCGGHKDRGLLMCWGCYRRTNARQGLRRVDRIMLDHAEHADAMSEPVIPSKPLGD